MDRTVIFSDTHLTTKFIPAKFVYLKNLINQYDQVIINGDFYSYYSCTFDEFANSKWNELFPLLKNKTIYLYGNHDRQNWCDERVNRFSRIQTNECKLKVGNKTLIITHGHRIAYDSIANETFIKYNRKLQIDKYNYALQGLLIRLFGAELYNFTVKKLENAYLDYAKKLKKDEILVTGHVHHPTLNLEHQYINTGYINYGHAYYIEIKDNKTNLKHETY